MIGTLSEQLMSQKDQLRIADVRSVANPLGMSQKAEQFLSSGVAAGIAARAALRERALQHYVGQGTGGPPVTRLDIVLSVDPFSRQSIQVLDRIEDAIRRGLPEQLAGNSEIYPIGPTASVRDLKVVADHDRLLINGLVIAVVLGVLLLLRLGVGLSLYLVATVVFSYLASLGVTFALFWRSIRSGLPASPGRCRCSCLRSSWRSVSTTTFSCSAACGRNRSVTGQFAASARH